MLKNTKKTKTYVGYLSYDSESGRYVLMNQDSSSVKPTRLLDGFRCGEGMEMLLPDGTWMETAIEMSWDQKWYLVDTGRKGNLENIIVRVTYYCY